MRQVPNSGRRVSLDFRQILAAFLAQPGLPFASVLSVERMERVFAKHNNLFGGRQIYSTAVMLWSFLAQVLRDGKEAACQAAVANIVGFNLHYGLPVPTSDTGDYCRARRKLSTLAIRDLTREIAAEAEVQAKDKWKWKGFTAKLIDGTTFTMPDTPANQAAFPQSGTQKQGVGLPIARMVVVLSLATACVLDMALGRYAGKETGETALLRQMFNSLSPGDLLVMDRYYSSFLMLAQLRQRNVQACVRMHQLRHLDFRRGKRLGAYDHLIAWTKGARPKWMDQATYNSLPETLVMRELKYQITIPGRRTKQLVIATTLLDAQQYSRAEIATLYGFRWNSELDIRSIKQSLNMAHARCQTPEMVVKEVWTRLLAYNLIRTTAATAAALHDKQPRQIGFTAVCQFVIARWMYAAGTAAPTTCLILLEQISTCEVGNRPGRIEPRVLKRRLYGYKLMQEPRHIWKDKLVKGKNT